MIIDMDKLKSIDDQVTYVPKFTNIDYTKDKMIEALNRINDKKLHHEEMVPIIVDTFHELLTTAFISSPVGEGIVHELFRNIGFLNSFGRCIDGYERCITLSCSECININTLIWETYSNADKELKDALLDLSEKINRTYIVVLQSFVGEYARVLALAAHSHIDEAVCIRRVNAILVSIKDITAQTIINVYSTLYHSSLTNLFVSTILYDSDVDRDKYSLIYYSIFTILENLDPVTVWKVLYAYSQIYDFAYDPQPTVSLHNDVIKQKFPRTYLVVQQMEANGIQLH